MIVVKIGVSDGMKVKKMLLLILLLLLLLLMTRSIFATSDFVLDTICGGSTTHVKVVEFKT